MAFGNPHQQDDEKPFKRLRMLASKRQQDLKDRFHSELQVVEDDDVVTQVRVKHKYRLLGLHI